MSSRLSFFRRAFGTVWNLVIGIGGGGAVTTIVNVATAASAPQLGAIGLFSTVFFVGVAGLYRAAHPPEPDLELRQFRQAKIERWLACLDEARANGWRVERHGHPIVYESTSEFAELEPLLTEAERSAFESTYDEAILYRAIARVEREWGLI